MKLTCMKTCCAAKAGRPAKPASQVLLKLLVIMKLTAFLLTVILVQVHAHGVSQKVSFTGSNVRLENVFASIKAQSGFVFFYDEELLQKTRPVTLHLKDLPLQAALDRCLEGQPLSYIIKGKLIVIEEKKAYVPQNASRADAGLAFVKIPGRIIGVDNQPLFGVSVMIKGSRAGTTTDNNGQFSINAIKGDVLVVSFVGHKSIEVTVGDETYLDIMLVRNDSPLDDIQVIAYGTSSRRLSTGAVSTVKAETIERQPVGNVLSALSGNVPGLSITQSTGVPGASFRVSIRGLNSLGGANSPLFLIDGVPFSSEGVYPDASIFSAYGGISPLASINPNDIESVDVLKDADATAIYGSRGANGVVLITTKKGKSGREGVELNVSQGIGKVSRKLKMLSTRQYLDMRYAAFANDNIDWRSTDVTANDLKVWDTTRYTDWQKELIGGTAQYTNARLTVSGGNQYTQFSVNGSYWRETAVYPGDFANQKLSGRFGVSHRSYNNKFRMDFSTMYMYNDNRLPSFDLTSPALRTPPVAPEAFQPDGGINWAGGTFQNPMAAILQLFEGKTNNINASTLVSYQLLKTLSVKTLMGYNRIDHDMINLNGRKAINPFEPFASSSADYNTSTTSSWNLEPYLEYEARLGPGKTSITVGTTLQATTSQSTRMNGRDYLDDDLMRNPAAAGDLQVSPSTKIDYRYNAVFGRLNYNVQNKYVANFTLRRDGSSRFGPGRKFGTFGAVGLGWIFSEETFIKNTLSFLSYGKLRTSYGITGSDAIGDYAYLPSYTPVPSFAQYAGGTAMTPDRLYNENFGWEQVKKADIQLELGFLNDRLLLSGNYYHNRSSNQLVGLPLPATTGFQSINSNLGATVQNTGWELTVNSVNVKGEDLSWTTAFNITIPKNKLIAYPGLETSTNANILAVGYAINLEKVYDHVGVNPLTGVNVYRDRNGKDTSFISSTFFQQADRVAMMEVVDHYFGGLNNSINYKGLTLDFTFQFARRTRRNDIATFNSNVPGFQANQPVYVFQNSWRAPGDEALFQKFTTRSGTPAYRSRHEIGSEGQFEDVSFIRLNNLALSYQLPQRWQEKLHAKNCRIYVQGQNLITITNFKGLDPEGSSSTLPRLSVVTAGVQVNF